AVVAGQQVGDAALAGLRVHPDHRLVGAAEVGRVDRQIRYAPGEFALRRGFGGGAGPVLGEALLDGVLVGAAERGVHQIARVGMPGVHLDPVAVFDHAADRVDVGEVDH